MSSSRDGLETVKKEAADLARQLQTSRSKDEALETAIKAAEVSMRALKLAKDPTEQSELSGNVKRLLEKAESIKQDVDWRAVIRPSPITVAEPSRTAQDEAALKSRALTEPVSTRKLTTREKILILKGGFLHGFKFPPWESMPAPSEFELQDGESLFEDTQRLPLSELQEDVFDDWKRPADALPPPAWLVGNKSKLGPTMTADGRVDLMQDAATDCSVVASLSATVSRLERGYGKISKTLLCPYDLECDHPIMSKNGKYMSRLNFNGCFRKVVIDDRLPTSSTARAIHVVDKANPGLLWPALIEKAYLKVRGGYDFPGSNSGTDLWILTGWIPEQVFLQSDELDPERLWRRICAGFSYGDVLITMGTGTMSDKTEKELGLAGEHDYAVLDLREVNGQRLMLVKNPWCEGTSWRGKTVVSEQTATTRGRATSDVPAPQSADEPVQNPRDLLNSQDELSPGTFWMDLDNVMQHFESTYLNWNPGLFKFRQDIHFSWDLSLSGPEMAVSRGRFGGLAWHPQFSVSTQQGGIIWILLCRHFSNAVPADATREEIEDDRYGIELKGHMSLLAFSSQGKRVLLPEKFMQKGWFVDSPQTLLKLEDCTPGEKYTVVPAEDELPSIDHTFTIATFANSPITLEEASSRFPHTKKVAGAWTKETAGGNANSPLYSTNPQFSITVTIKTRISLLLEAMNDEVNIHIRVAHGRGKRVHSVRNKDVVFDSKEYRRGCCVAEHDSLEPGQYTIICSTFEPHQLSDFNVTVESSHQTAVALLPKEGAGRVRLEPPPAVFMPGQSRIAAPLLPRRIAKIYAIARPLAPPRSALVTSSAQRSLVRMSIEVGRVPHLRQIALSGEGEFADCAGGIRTSDVDLGPEMNRYGDVWLVLERMSAGSSGDEERHAIELFVDQLDALDCGEWRAMDHD